MQIQIKPKPQFLINAFLVLFVMHDIQVGIGIQGFQRSIYADAKQDAWIAVLLSGLLTMAVTFLIIKTLQLYGSADIYGIHHDIYGKWLGKLFNLFYIFYCLMAFLIVIRNYTEVVQAWIFPEVPNWVLTAFMMILVIYGITGGIRVIVGISFFNVLASIWVYALISVPLQFADYHSLLPVLESDLSGILKATYNMTLTVLGFEIIYVLFPFFKEKNQVQRYAQIGLVITTLVYLFILLVSIVYFSPGQMERSIWGTLSLFKIVRFPFIERLEYITIAYWMLIILPNLLFYMWAAVKGMERAFNQKEVRSLLFFSICIFIAIAFFKTRVEINRLNQWFGKAAFYITYCYPILLYIFAVAKKKLNFFKEQKA